MCLWTADAISRPVTAGWSSHSPFPQLTESHQRLKPDVNSGHMHSLEPQPAAPPLWGSHWTRGQVLYSSLLGCSGWMDWRHEAFSFGNGASLNGNLIKCKGMSLLWFGRREMPGVSSLCFRGQGGKPYRDLLLNKDAEDVSEGPLRLVGFGCPLGEPLKRIAGHLQFQQNSRSNSAG